MSWTKAPTERRGCWRRRRGRCSRSSGTAARARWRCSGASSSAASSRPSPPCRRRRGCARAPAVEERLVLGVVARQSQRNDELRDALLPVLLPRVAQLNNTTRIVRNGVGSALLIRYSSHESRETGPAPGRPPDRSPHASSRSSLHPLTLSAHCDDDFMKPRACGAARPRAQSSGRGRRAPPAARRTCARGGRARAARQLRVAVAVGGGGGVAALGGDLRLRRRRGRRGRVQAVREAGGARAAPRESAARRGRAAGCAYPCAVTGES